MPKSVSVKKEKVLEVLTANRIKHIKEYNEAVEGWIERVRTKLGIILTDVMENGIKADVGFHLPKPQSFEKEYDKAIGMIQLEEGDIIEVSSDDYDRFFLDEWSWKRSFLDHTQMYKIEK